MHQIWSQVVGLLVITAWSAGVSSLIFFILKINNKLRLSPEVEIAGSDVVKHGEAAYPELAHDTKNQENTIEVDIKLLMINFYHSYFQIQSEKEDKVADIEKNDSGWGSLKKKKKNSRTNNIQLSNIPVTPLKFRKIKHEDNTKIVTDDDDEDSSSSSESDYKNQMLTGIVNGAFEDSVDYTAQNNMNTTYQETHFDVPDEPVEHLRREKLKKTPLKLVLAQDRAIDFNNSRESPMI